MSPQWFLTQRDATQMESRFVKMAEVVSLTKVVISTAPALMSMMAFIVR